MEGRRGRTEGKGGSKQEKEGARKGEREGGSQGFINLHNRKKCDKITYQ